MAQTVKCLNCSEENADHMLRCEWCGHDLYEENTHDAEVSSVSQIKQYVHDGVASVVSDRKKQGQGKDKKSEPWTVQDLKLLLAELGVLAGKVVIVGTLGGIAGGVMLTVVAVVYRVFVKEYGVGPSFLLIFSPNGAIVFGIGFVFGALYYLSEKLSKYE